MQAAYGRLVHACLRLARAPLAKLPKLTLLKTYVGIWQTGRYRPVAFTRDTLAEETVYRLEDTLPSEDEDGDGDGCVAGASVQYEQDEVVHEEELEDELPLVDIDDFYAEDWLGRGDEGGGELEDELPFEDIDDLFAEDWLRRGDEGGGEPMEELVWWWSWWWSWWWW